MFGIMAVLLGSGDAFHLVPRAVALCTTGLENFTVQMGLGKWITSITMTILKSSPPQNLQQVVANSDCRQSPGIAGIFYCIHRFSGIMILSERRCFL